MSEATEMEVVVKTANEDGNTTKNYSLSWEHIDYKVNVKDHFWSKPHEKVLLKDVAGFVPPGKLLAIMGPSGSGKSTLLDVLAGRIIMETNKNKSLTGEILVNGTPRADNFKRLAAYGIVSLSRHLLIVEVMQDDTLQGSLSVRDNLRFSANLRLPKTYSHEQKEQTINEIIEVLGLTRSANTAVGDVFRRGVSGGERRRVSVGMELLSLPRILFLDEPTSGLDGLSAFKLCDYLRKIASHTGITIIATIHQPSTSTFNCFDYLLLLSRGQQVYFGLREGAAEFFDRAGKPVPGMTNPADYYADTINYEFEDSDEKKLEIQGIVDLYSKSKEKTRVVDMIEHSKTNKVEIGKVPHYETSFLVQSWFLMLRTLKVYMKNPGFVHVRVFMYTCMGLLLGSCYWKLSIDQTHVQDRISFLFFAGAFLAFMSIAAFPSLIEERLLFVRERANGYYRVGAFVVSHSLVQLPFTLLMSLCFTIIAYWMIDLNDKTDHFWYFLLTLWGGLYVAESMVIMIAAVIPYYLIGIAIAAAMFGVFMVLNGYFIKKSNIPEGWIWMHYLAFHKYLFEGFMVNEFDGRSFACQPATGGASSCVCLYPDLNGDCVISGNEILDYFDYSSVDKWNNLGYLCIFILVFRIMFYLALRFLNKPTR